jgi:hypothetical protein
MAEYVELPLTADATALSDIGKDYLAEEIPDWNPRPGNVESILLESTGQIGAEVVDQAAQVPPVHGYWESDCKRRLRRPRMSRLHLR